MPNWDPKRWKLQKDGSYTRRVTGVRAAYDEKPIYTSMTRPRLIAECHRRGIAEYGSKKILIERLEKNDAKREA